MREEIRETYCKRVPSEKAILVRIMKVCLPCMIDKPTFGSDELAQRLALLAQQDELDITLVVLCTDICAVPNALIIKALLPETPIRVIANCCAGVTPESHHAALKTMQMCQTQIQ